jgi:hypothetical protein
MRKVLILLSLPPLLTALAVTAWSQNITASLRGTVTDPSGAVVQRRLEEVRLAEHRRFRLDPAHPPAENSQPVDHGGVRIGPNQRIGKENGFGALLFRTHHLGEEFQIHLVNDSGSRRNHPEIRKSLLAPTQKLITLAIALKFNFRVPFERNPLAEHIHLYGVVDHQIDGNKRIDAFRIASQAFHRRAHRREIDDGRNTCKILQDCSRRLKWDITGRRSARIPGSERDDVLFLHPSAAAVAQKIFQKDAKRKRQF